MKKTLLLSALCLSIGMQAAWAQTKAKGRVTDEKGEGLPGASVKVSGTTTGTITDVDGNFEVEVPEGAQVIINALGYGEKKLAPNENMKITMSQGENSLTEVTVVQPYGPPITKEKYTGAADVITSKQIEKMPVSDFTKALEGAAPGLQLTNGGGQPGSGASIRIRGVGSLSGGTAPLLVVDGNAYDGDITAINPNDIENVTVLKDAVSTSQFGSRGANGVIVVTTKRGRKNEAPRITVDGKVGTINRALPLYDVMTNPGDYYETAWRSLYNRQITTLTGGLRQPTDAEKKAAGDAASGITGQGIVDQLGYNAYNIPGVDPAVQNALLIDPVTGKLNPNAQLRYQDDWQKEMQRTGVRQDYNLSVSGGSENTDYYLSAGYLKEKGYLLNTDYERFTSRMNVNSRATDWATVGMNLSATMSTQNGLSSNTGSSSANPSYMSLSTPPIFPVYYRDSLNNKVIDPYTGKYKYDYGSLAQDPDFSMGDRAGGNGNSNVIGQMQLNENRYKNKNIVFSPYFEAKFLKDFTFRTNLTTNYTNQDITFWSTSLHGQFMASKGSLFLNSYNYFNYSWNQNLSWHHNFKEDHDVNISLVHENYYFQQHTVSANNTGFPGENFRDLAVATGTQGNTSYTYDERLESYLALASYAYKGKYLFNGNIRRDGLSRFSPDARWGTFYAVGAAWIISDENFMKNVRWVNNLKLKASYGTQGNKEVLSTDGSSNYYAWQGLYDLSRPNGANSAAIPVTLTNPGLKWEKQTQVNLGLEFTLFNQRLSGELNVFNRSNVGLYFNVPNPPSTAFNTKLVNAADVSNKGIELNLYVTAVQTRNFSWKVNANFTKFKNTINKLAGESDSSIRTVTMWKKGHSVYDYYLVHSSVDPRNGDELYRYYDADGNAKDTNNYVFAVNNKGRQFTGSSAIPKLSGAITNTFNYKNFELSFLISYGIGGKYYDGTYQNLMQAGDIIGSTNFHNDIKDSWTPENPNASLPRVEVGNVNIGQQSDRWLVDASYLNIRNINLSYGLPANLAAKAHMKSVSVSLAVDNVWLFSKRQGMNPQNNFSGVSDYVYVPGRTIVAGLRLGL